MSDRELLELAAKAAGLVIDFDPYIGNNEDDVGCFVVANGLQWDPLTDDGDALRLAVKLGMTVHSGQAYSVAGEVTPEKNNGDPCAATRRAIVRAAAEIGKAMQ